jgi:hypothetical protein
VRNERLADDYLRRAASRILAIEVLLRERSWADVVRESQEVVELVLKALLRAVHVEVPQLHDVSPLLLEHRDRLPAAAAAAVEELAGASRSLRRDRELAFCGSEDLTPSDFYQPDDAERAMAMARRVLEVAREAIGQLA